jgi:hypothetical protein
MCAGLCVCVCVCIVYIEQGHDQLSTSDTSPLVPPVTCLYTIVIDSLVPGSITVNKNQG